MNLFGKKDDTPALVSCEKRHVANYEIKQRGKRRHNIDMKMIQARAKALSADKVIINYDGHSTELQFLKGRGVAVDVISKRLITRDEIIDITFKANMPMLTYSKEHDEDNIMLRQLKVDDDKAEDLAMERDIQTLKARAMPPKREQEKEAYYQDLIKRYEAEKAESQPSRMKHVTSAADQHS